LAAVKLVEVLRGSHLEVIRHRHRQGDECHLGEFLNHGGTVHPQERLEGLRPALARSELVGESGNFLRVVPPALRLDPHLATKRESMYLLAGMLTDLQSCR